MSRPVTHVVATPGVFEGMGLDAALRLMFECYAMMPLRQMRACGEPAHWGEDPDQPGVLFTWIEADGEDEAVSACGVLENGNRVTVFGCWCGLDKWDALMPRGLPEQP